MNDNRARGMAWTAAANEVAGIPTNKRRYAGESDDSDVSLPKRPRYTSRDSAGDDDLSSTDLPDWSDDGDLSMSYLRAHVRRGEAETETPRMAFTAINASSTLDDHMSRILKTVLDGDNLKSSVTDTAPPTTLDSWSTTHGLINGRTLDEIFTGDAKHISDFALYEMSRIFTIPSIIERTNLGRQGDVVAEPMLRKRLGDYKKKVLAAGFKCAYDFEHVLNKGRHDHGHRGVRMPSANGNCAQCETCLQWHDPVEPSKVFEYWARAQGVNEVDDSAESESAAPTAEASAISGALEGKIKLAAPRRTSVARSPLWKKHDIYDDSRSESSSIIFRTWKRKHSTTMSSTTIDSSSSESGSSFQVAGPPSAAPLRKTLAAKSTNLFIKSRVAANQKQDTTQGDSR